MVKNKGEIKVFLCYHEIDIQSAQKVYDELRQNTLLKVWFEKEKLLPGKTKDIEFEQAIKESDFFILLFSSKSSNKTGNFQYQIRTAMRYAQKKPENTVFIMPVRLDESEIHFEILNTFQHIDFFSKSDESKEYMFRQGILGLLKSIANETNRPEILDENAMDFNYKNYEGQNKEVLKERTEHAGQKYIKNQTEYENESLRLNSREYFIAGLYSFACGNHEEALRRFYQSLNNGFPSTYHPQVFSKIGACYIKSKNLIFAKRMLLKAIEADPSYPSGYYNYGILLKKEGEVLKNKGELRGAIDKLNESMAQFEESIKKMKELEYYAVLARNNIATTQKDLYVLGEGKGESYLDRGIEELEKLVKEKEKINKKQNSSDKKNILNDSGLTLYNLACFYSLKNKLIEAYDALLAAFEEDFMHVIDSKSDAELNNVKVYNADKYKKDVKKLCAEHIKKTHKIVADLLAQRDKSSIKRAIFVLNKKLLKIGVLNLETYHLLSYCFFLLGNKEKEKEYISLYEKYLNNSFEL